MKTTKTLKIGKFKRTVTKETDPTNYKKTPLTTTIYGKNDQKIKKSKTVVTELGDKKKVKTIDYGPVNYYGKQTRTVKKLGKLF